jgi:hypothetical protein
MNFSGQKSGIELFENEQGGVYQCDKTNRIYVYFANTVAAFRIDNFLNFKRLVDSVDIHNMIYDLSDACDHEVIDLPNASKKIKLTLCEVIHLRELLAGAKFAIYVNDFLNDTFYETVV